VDYDKVNIIKDGDIVNADETMDDIVNVCSVVNID